MILITGYCSYSLWVLLVLIMGITCTPNGYYSYSLPGLCILITVITHTHELGILIIIRINHTLYLDYSYSLLGLFILFTGIIHTHYWDYSYSILGLLILILGLLILITFCIPHTNISRSTRFSHYTTTASPDVFIYVINETVLHLYT